jgi:hypothetical protein
MKKYIKPIFIAFVIIAGLTLTQVTFAQPPAPPSSGSNGGANTPMGGAAPLDGGIVFLLAAGVGYGAKKVYNARSSRREVK